MLDTATILGSLWACKFPPPYPEFRFDDFQRLPEPRQRYIAHELGYIEEYVAVTMDAWFTYPPQERREELAPTVFLMSLEAAIGIAQEHKHLDVPGENFSWWIFHDSWYPELLHTQSITTIVPQILIHRLNTPIPRIEASFQEYLAWLQRQNEYLCDAIDQFYEAKDYTTMYVQLCALFTYLATIYLVLQRLRLSGQYQLPSACGEH